jgi:hypothetical protein
MYLSRFIFERARRKLNGHLYYSTFGPLFVIFMGGAFIGIANKLGFLPVIPEVFVLLLRSY